ncbi:ATP phosphoribosyltransferase regulatory subunit [Streptomyces beijiangensis]|uniref:Histidyl-tRNA synthetase n=1 Tax=Streptomyces beijiangensis TaxID=163361 RepID=A0A939FA13_9ACTN|nr:HisS family protein [Streptomyces beijiangensis]MBO0514807.1 histidine--tRNA ligase family protein [Streptomyces beijiangensis]
MGSNQSVPNGETPRPPLDISMPGFPESLPSDVMFEQETIRIIKDGFERSGFRPLDTAAIQRQEVLVAGGAQYLDGGIPEFAFSVTEPPESYTGANLALRYDLTVPVSRFIAEHSDKLAFPLHSYQINKVWRAEQMPTATHWREFYQCDVDVIGRDELSLLYDAEIACALNSAFQNIGVDGFTVRISNRKVLAALLDSHGVRVHRARSIVQIVDKGNKQEFDETVEQLTAAGIPAAVAADLGRLVGASTLEEVRALLKLRGADTTGVEELDTVLRAAADLGMPEDRLVLDCSITRGHDYYTGTVFETFATGREHWGAIGAGGRYEDLLKHVNGGNYPGVGMSVGLARLMGLLREDGVAAERGLRENSVVVLPRAAGTAEAVVQAVRKLRDSGYETRAIFDPVDEAGAKEIAAESKVAAVVEIGLGGETTVYDVASGSRTSSTLEGLPAGLRPASN